MFHANVAAARREPYQFFCLQAGHCTQGSDWNAHSLQIIKLICKAGALPTRIILVRFERKKFQKKNCIFFSHPILKERMKPEDKCWQTQEFRQGNIHPPPLCLVTPPSCQPLIGQFISVCFLGGGFILHLVFSYWSTSARNVSPI